MELIKKYRTILAIVIPVLLLVIIWQFGRSHFKPDAKHWAKPSYSHNNVISYHDISSIPGDKLLINLDSCSAIKNKFINSIDGIPADKILAKDNIRRIRQHNGPLLLHSCDPALSARIWMVLSQLGISDLYILSDDAIREQVTK
jgi:hypothetical protein